MLDNGVYLGGSNESDSYIFLNILRAIFFQIGSHFNGAFFQRVRFIFQISQSPPTNIPKNYPELEIPPISVNNLGAIFILRKRVLRVF
jgi:hypothetical protein